MSRTLARAVVAMLLVARPSAAGEPLADAEITSAEALAALIEPTLFCVQSDAPRSDAPDWVPPAPPRTFPRGLGRDFAGSDAELAALLGNFGPPQRSGLHRTGTPSTLEEIVLSSSATSVLPDFRRRITFEDGAAIVREEDNCLNRSACPALELRYEAGRVATATVYRGRRREAHARVHPSAMPAYKRGPSDSSA